MFYKKILHELCNRWYSWQIDTFRSWALQTFAHQNSEFYAIRHWELGK